jgi:DNA-binding MarR family transcriptional regulator
VLAPGSSGDQTPDLAAVADRVLETVPRVMRRIRRAMRPSVSGDTATTVPQLRALLHVRTHPGCSLSALAEHLGMTSPACSGLVERLVRAGWLERTTDPRERRRVQLRLTASGMEQVARANLRARTWLVQGLTDLPVADLEALQATLGLLERVTAEVDLP